MPSPTTAAGRRELSAFYLDHLHRVLLPFWLERAVDTERGGVFTCFDNRGEVLVSRDKYTWSQGRFAWMTARLARLAKAGVVRGDPEDYLGPARRTVGFLRDHVLVPDAAASDGSETIDSAEPRHTHVSRGAVEPREPREPRETRHCAYLLSEDGRPKEAFEGAGLTPSRFADAFVVLGAGELAAAEAAVGDPDRGRDIAAWALSLHRPLAVAMATGNVPSAPYPIPTGHTAHSFPMIMVNVSQTLGDALRLLGHEATAELDADRQRFVQQVLAYTHANGAVTEVRRREPTSEDAGGAVRTDPLPADPPPAGSLLLRHANPGHALESMWFVLHESLPKAWDDVTQRALKVIEHSLDIGWDPVHGGLLRFVSPDGGSPMGDLRNGGESRGDGPVDAVSAGAGAADGDGDGAEPMERLIRETWSSKLWWPHSEALYASLLAYRVGGKGSDARWYERLHGYVFDTFPNPDASVGEWIQIRDRQGAPLDRVVALPVKDPFHIVRNVLAVLELLSRWESDPPVG